MDIELSVFELVINGSVVDIDLNKYVPIDPDRLIQEYATQPAAYAYLATLCAQVEAEYLDAKRITERAYAEADSNVRGLLASQGTKYTESGVKALIEQSESYRVAVDNETQARAQMLLLKAVVTAMEQRAQMLISLGAHLRMEADMTGMSVKSVREKLDELKAAHA